MALILLNAGLPTVMPHACCSQKKQKVHKQMRTQMYWLLSSMWCYGSRGVWSIFCPFEGQFHAPDAIGLCQFYQLLLSHPDESISVLESLYESRQGN